LSENQEIGGRADRTTTQRCGLQRYEISNYARPGFHSRHNLNYWQSGDYLGIGAGAHSHKRVANHRIYGQRWWNEKNPARYMSKISESGQAVIDAEESDLAQSRRRVYVLWLQLIDGICLDALVTRFGKSASELYPQISGWVGEGPMETDDNRLRLTPRGILLLTPFRALRLTIAGYSLRSSLLSRHTISRASP
jgi:oxygen-independent coproporphyrinogen-3 oxidase